MPDASPPPPNGRRRAFLIVAALVLLAGLAYGVQWWRGARFQVSTENAYVRADVTPVSARVAGTVAQVLVGDNDAVAAGDVLVELDRSDLEIELRTAEARLASAQSQVRAYRAAIRAARASADSAAAEADRAAADLRRVTNLARQQVVSRQQLDHARTAYRVAETRRAAAMDEYERALSSLGGNPDLPTEKQSLVREARAALDQAKLNLEYATVRAPTGGYVSQKHVQAGQRVQVGEPLLALVALDAPHVVANFKETQLTDIRIGQSVEIVVDVYPDTHFQGRVDSIDSGTGAAFSLLPAQNASGNWVKVVQRVPVKVVLEGELPAAQPLRVGLSAEVKVDTRDRTGPPLRARNDEPRGQQRAGGASRSVQAEPDSRAGNLDLIDATARRAATPAAHLAVRDSGAPSETLP